MSKELSTAVTPMQMLQTALEKGADIDQMSKLMDMQERWEANEAKKAYVRAMTAFKAESTTITKDREVSYGNTYYRHASLAGIVKSINDGLAENGLSHKWQLNQGEGRVKVTCTITHELGYSESTAAESMPDVSGNKNSIQAVGSAITYLQRYTLLSLTGLATDEDDDGIAAASDMLNITDAQVAAIEKLLKASGGNDEAFLKYLNINSVSDMQQRDYDAAFKLLEKKARGKQ